MKHQQREKEKEMEAKKSLWKRLVSWFKNRDSDAEHEACVSLVVGLMVAHMTTDNEVLVYTDSLKPSFFAEILSDSECQFRILVGSSSAVRVIDSLPLSVKARIIVRVSGTTKSNHFLVAGDSFRYERDDCKDEMYAVCNFNEPVIAQRLRDRFERMWGNSTPILTS